jgi:hypothetical protein
LNVVQSADERRPLLEAEAVGILKVIVSLVAVMEKSLPVVVVANVMTEPFWV